MMNDKLRNCGLKYNFSNYQALTCLIFSAISSISHLGVEVAPHTPTLETNSGKRSVISSAAEMN